MKQSAALVLAVVLLAGSIGCGGRKTGAPRKTVRVDEIPTA